MPARVAIADIRGMLATSLSDAQLQVFCDQAHLIVSEDVEPKGGMSEARLKMIESYLGAHFATIVEERGGLTSSETGDSRESYAGLLTYGQGLMLTRFGQQAVSMDPSGALSNMATGKPKARFRVV